MAAAPSSGPVVLSLEQTRSPAGLVTTWIAEFITPAPRTPKCPELQIQGDGEGQDCTSDKLPGAAATAGTGTAQSWSISAVSSQLSWPPSLMSASEVFDLGASILSFLLTQLWRVSDAFTPLSLSLPQASLKTTQPGSPD